MVSDFVRMSSEIGLPHITNVLGLAIAAVSALNIRLKRPKTETTQR